MSNNYKCPFCDNILLYKKNILGEDYYECNTAKCGEHKSCQIWFQKNEIVVYNLRKVIDYKLYLVNSRNDGSFNHTKFCVKDLSKLNSYYVTLSETDFVSVKSIKDCKMLFDRYLKLILIK